MKKWNIELEVSETDDEFFQSLQSSNQHEVLKNFILDVLHANGFESKIRLTKYQEFIEEDFSAYVEKTVETKRN